MQCGTAAHTHTHTHAHTHTHTHTHTHIHAHAHAHADTHAHARTRTLSPLSRSFVLFSPLQTQLFLLLPRTTHHYHLQGQPSSVRVFTTANLKVPISAKSFFKADTVDINWASQGE